MAKASDNLFPYLHLVPAAAPAAPAAGAQRLYLDSADSNKLKRKDSAGSVTTVEGGGGGSGSVDGQFAWSYQPWQNGLTAIPLEVRTAGTYAYNPALPAIPSASVGAGGFIFNSSHAQNDAIEFYVWLAPGTYSLYVMSSTDVNRGIQTWALDDGAGAYTTLGTLDWYVASGASNNINKSITGWVVGGSTLVRRKLRCKVATKNASSSDYYLALQQIDVVRTA